MTYELRRGAPEDTIRFGLIGCGRIAQAHVEALEVIEQASLAAIVDVREEVANAEAERHGARVLTDYSDPALLDLVDAVIVCTPPNTHHEIGKHFLENGIHVLCEKPLTIDPTHARELVDVATDHNMLLMMASKFRYVDDVVKAKSIIESGILGKVILFENTFCAKVPMKDRWNANREVAGGGVIIDNGSHSVDIARYLLGPVREVQADTAIRAQDLDVEDTARLTLRTKNGPIGHVDLSWSITKESAEYVSVFGTEGTLLVGWAGSRYRQDGSSQWVEFGSGYDKRAAFKRQLVNFMDTLKGRAEPLIAAEDALASVQVIRAAYRSAAQDSWVPVDPTRNL